MQQGSDLPGASTHQAARSRGRGRGSSRGASNSSRKLPPKDEHHAPPTAPRALREVNGGSRGNHSSYIGRNFDPNYKNRYSNSQGPLPSPHSENAPDHFEQTRRENAAKRIDRGQHAAKTNMSGNRGRGRGGSYSNKQVRFDISSRTTTDNETKTPSGPASSAPSNFFSSKPSTHPFATPAAPPHNPFAPVPAQAAKKAFQSPFPAAGTFGAPSQPSNTSNAFGQVSSFAAQPSAHPFGAPSAPYGVTSANTVLNGASTAESSTSSANASFFASPQGHQSAVFGAPSVSKSPEPSAGLFRPSNSNGPVDPPKPNSFGAPSFQNPSTSPNPFGAPSQTPIHNPFGAPSQPSARNTFGIPSQSFPPATFGAQSQPSVSTSFEVHSGSQPPNLSMTNVDSPAFNFGSLGSKTANSTSNSSSSNSNSFGLPSSTQATSSKNASVSEKTPFGAPSVGFAGNPATSGGKSATNKFGSGSQSSAVLNPALVSSSAFGKEIKEHLKRERINAPTWPSTPGDPKSKDLVDKLWQDFKKYRQKVRGSLIRGGLLDDPDKPKKLSEAIDFKGVCEDMCPEFEKITRIMDVDVHGAEKDNSHRPELGKMVKAMARSAAGQEAPLPMDVRSPAALRRTLDYLFNDLLGNDENLPKVHGFLWDRTRAIRRDFVFQQSSMDAAELSDQVYCLERITRFHVTAAHLMSNDVFKAAMTEPYVEQQEVEQLGKTLLSLMHAYEDCEAQGIVCESEAEFRAYYILNNSHSSGILEAVQDWGWKFWGESDQIRTAVSLVESLQNIWDLRGPLKAYAATDIAQNGYSRFFTIVGDKKVSYTMACFAEIHFNSVRKAALKTIVTAYKKQRDQTKDWTLTKLNTYMNFDDEEDIINFAEAYGLRFEEGEDDTYLAIDSDEMREPFPPLPQSHSYSLVERKRGQQSLSAAIHTAVFDEAEVAEEESDEESLFVRDVGTSTGRPSSVLSPAAVIDEEPSPPTVSPSFQTQPPQQKKTTAQTPFSVFDQGPKPSPPPFSFFNATTAVDVSQTQREIPQGGDATFSQLPEPATTLISSPAPMSAPFSFLNQPSAQSSAGTAKSAPSFDQPTATSTSLPIEIPRPFSFGQAISGIGNSGQTLTPNLPVAASLPIASQTPSAPLSLERHVVTTSSQTESPKPAFSLGAYFVTPPPAPSVQDALVSSDRAPQGLANSSIPPMSFGTLAPQQKPNLGGSSFAPLQQLQQPSAQPSQRTNVGGSCPSTSFEVSAVAATQPSAVARSSASDKFVEWFVNGDGGLLENWTEAWLLENLHKTVKQYEAELVARSKQEDEDRAAEKAARARYRYLATKYSFLWRHNVRRQWMQRRREEVRKARQQMAESLRASKAAQSANVVEDFRKSTIESRRGSLESLLDATGVLDEVHNSGNEVRAIVRADDSQNLSRQSNRSSRSPAVSINGHRRGKSDNPLRRSLLSDPSYLEGGSRRLLDTKYDVKEENRRQISGVQTDYFRLKARGIATLPSGTPLANSVAKDLLHKKRSFDGIIRSTTPHSLMPPPASRSVPPKPVSRPGALRASVEREEQLQALKTRARAQVVEDRETRQKKRSLIDDEDLFARAKRVREQMDEGSEWYRKEIEASRSVS